MRGFAKLCGILFAFVLASLMVSSLAQRYLGHIGSGANVDFYVYYFAAQTVHENPRANLYVGAADGNPQTRNVPAGSELFARARAAGLREISFYIYPPLLADLLVPLSLVPPHPAAALWRVFNLILVLSSVLLLARMLQVPVLTFEFAVLTLAAYSFWPIHEAISNGQISIVLLTLWVIGIVAYLDDCMVISAGAFALATALKITPVLLVPLFILWKERRWLVSYLATSLGLVLAMVTINGLQTVSLYPTVVAAMGGGIPAMSNKSLSSLVTWIYYGSIFTMDSALVVMANPTHVVSIVARVVSCTFYLSCLLLVWRSRKWFDRASRASTIAIFGLVTACVSPVSWRNSYTIAFIVLAISWVRALRTPPRVLHVVLLALTTLTLGSLFFDLAAQAPLPQPCKILLAAAWVVSSVLFCLDVLFHFDADKRTSFRGDHDSAKLLESSRLEHQRPALLQDTVSPRSG